MRDISEIRADLSAAEARANRLGDEMMSYADRELSRGDVERFERLERGVVNARDDAQRYRDEWRDAIQRSASRGYVEDGDGARGRDRGDRGADNLSAGLLQSGRPYDHDTEDAIISRALRVVDGRHRELTTAAGDHVTELLRAERTDEYDPGYLARRLLITESRDYKSGLTRAIAAAQSGMPAILTAPEAEALRSYQGLENLYQRGFSAWSAGDDAIARAMSEGTTTAGGFGVPSLIDPSIILTSGAADAPLVKICRIVNVTTNTWKGISSAAMSWSYDSEAAAVSDDSVTLAQPTVTVFMARGYLPYSIEVGMDVPDWLGQMGQLLDQGYNDLLATKTMTGTGSGEPFGLFVALSNSTSVVTPTTDGSFGGPDIFKVWGALPERYRARATWVMSVQCQNAIRQFAASTSATSAYFSIDLTGGTFRINDRPVVISDYAPTGVGGSIPGTTGLQNILAVGDVGRSYLMANRAGMSIEAVPLVMDTSTGRPTGQRGMFAWSRHGFDSVDDNGFRMLQNQ